MDDADVTLDRLKVAVAALPPEVRAALRPAPGDVDCGVCAALRPHTWHPAVRELLEWHDPKGERADPLLRPVAVLDRYGVPTAVLTDAVQPIFGALVYARCLVIYALAGA